MVHSTSPLRLHRWRCLCSISSKMWNMGQSSWQVALPFLFLLLSLYVRLQLLLSRASLAIYLHSTRILRYVEVAVRETCSGHTWSSVKRHVCLLHPPALSTKAALLWSMMCAAPCENRWRGNDPSQPRFASSAVCTGRPIACRIPPVNGKLIEIQRFCSARVQISLAVSQGQEIYFT